MSMAIVKTMQRGSPWIVHARALRPASCSHLSLILVFTLCLKCLSKLQLSFSLAHPLHGDSCETGQQMLQIVFLELDHYLNFSGSSVYVITPR